MFFFRFRFFFAIVFWRNVFGLMLSFSLQRIYCLGFCLGFIFCWQIISGVALVFVFKFVTMLDLFLWLLFMLYDFDFCWLLRNIHIFFCTLLFLFIFIHIFKFLEKFLLYDSLFGIFFCGFLLLLCFIVEAFIGYVLPCTMMSYWGLVVFSNVIYTIPGIGFWIVLWVWCGEFINDFTLLKVHHLHVILPWLLFFFIFVHFFLLHFVISSDGFIDRFVFYYERCLFLCYFAYRDFFLLFLMFWFFFVIGLLNWYFVFHEESFLRLDFSKTADKIIPEWFFLFLFGFLKSIPDKFIGFFVVAFMFCIFCLLNFIFFCLLGRNHLLILTMCLVLMCVLCFVSFLAVLVVLCFPIWMELQFCVGFCLLFLASRLD